MSFINEILPVPIVNGYGSRMATDSFDAGLGFTVTLGLKVRPQAGGARAMWGWPRARVVEAGPAEDEFSGERLWVVLGLLLGPQGCEVLAMCF